MSFGIILLVITLIVAIVVYQYEWHLYPTIPITNINQELVLLRLLPQI
jgi:hypothetical protein